MNKFVLIALSGLIVSSTSLSAKHKKRDGGGFGVQFGGIAIGLGGSSKGPIIGLGPSPDPIIPLSAVVIPGAPVEDDNSNDNDNQEKTAAKKEVKKSRKKY